MKNYLNINLGNIVDGDYLSKDFIYDKVIEENGSFSLEQVLNYVCGGIEYQIEYNLSVAGSIHTYAGDYYTKPELDVQISGFECDVIDLKLAKDQLEIPMSFSDKKMISENLKKVLF